MSRYLMYKGIIADMRPCPDGHLLNVCPSCIAHKLAQLEANKCWYCKEERITRELTLQFLTHNLVHLVCQRCADALHLELCTFKSSDYQI